MQRIESRPIIDNEQAPTLDDILREVFGTRSGRIRGKGSGYKVSARGMTVTSARNEEVEELKSKLAEMTSRL